MREPSGSALLGMPDTSSLLLGFVSEYPIFAISFRARSSRVKNLMRLLGHMRKIFPLHSTAASPGISDFVCETLLPALARF